MRCLRFAAIIVSATLLFAACGDDGYGSSNATSETTGTTSETTGTTVTTPAADAIVVTVAGGSVDGPGRVEVSTGDEVTATVTSDVADEIHVHGIDETFDIAAGETKSITFVASLPGVYEVELEDSKLVLFELAVS